MRLLLPILAAALAAPAALAAQGPGAPAPPAPGAIREVLRHECGNRYGHRGVVLFSDGMVRLKEGPPGEEAVTLHKLDPDRYQGFLTRLREEEKPDVFDLQTEGPVGDGVEACRFVLELPGEERLKHRFRRYDTLPLPLARLLAIAGELTGAAEEVAAVGSLASDYEPRAGDVLERRDGLHFEVIRFTSDKGGLELRGVDQPLTVYVPIGAVRGEFVALVSRREP